MASRVEPGDRLAIHDAIALYGHVLDERRWSALAQVFTADAVVDYSSLGQPVMHGLAEIERCFSGYASPPRAHHVTNVVVALEDGEVCARSKGLMLLADGVLSSWIYRDRLRRLEGGWRIAHRLGMRVELALATTAHAPR